MFPTINKIETGVNLRRIMDMKGIKPRDIQEYLGLGCVQSIYRWLDGVSMPTVDESTELWLGEIEEKLDYKWWYAGHYHTSRIRDKVQIMFEDIEEFPCKLL